jgi:hypothetical protein
MQDQIRFSLLTTIKRLLYLSFPETLFIIGGIVTTLAKNVSDVAENFLLGHIVDCLTKQGSILNFF